MVFLPATAALVAGCGSGELRRSDATPSHVPTTQVAAPAPVSPPQATPTASPTPAPVLRSSGWLVYLRGGDLYVGALDGGGEQRLTTGSLGAGYVGYVRDGPTTWVYYTSLIERAAPDDIYSVGTVRLLRRRLGSDEEQRIETFRGSRVNLDGDSTSGLASVTSNGHLVAYAADEGIDVLNVDTRVAERWLTDSCYPSGGTSTPPACEHGVAYVAPLWSPDGRWLAASKVLYEGAVLALVRTDRSESVELTFGDDFKAWAPDGARLCAPQSGYLGYKPAGIAEVSSRTFTELIPSGVASAPASSCAWSADGRIAIAFVGHDSDSIDHLGFFDSGGRPIASFDLTSPALWVSTWLPDGSGVVVARALPGPDYSNPLINLDNTAVMLDGTSGSLPFAAGRVLGAIPPFNEN